MWRIEQSNAEKQASGKSADGTAGGRGRKKTLPPNDGKVSQDRHARSTAGQIAADAKVSERKAAQAVAVAKAKPELLEQVKSGVVKLKDAAKQVKATAPERPAKRSEPSYMDAKTRCMGKLNDAIIGVDRLWETYPGKHEDIRAAVKKCIDEGLEYTQWVSPRAPTLAGNQKAG
jgi:hypothetical protein